MRTFLFDTETDGLIKNLAIRKEKWPRVIEVYGCIDQDGEIVEEIDVLVNPGRKIAEMITKITGITNDDLAQKPALTYFSIQLTRMIESCDRVVAHNAAFDKGIIDLEFERTNQPAVKWPQVFCTIENTEHYLGRRLKLIELYEHFFGEKFEGAHRAKTDVVAMVRCYREMVKRGDA